MFGIGGFELFIILLFGFLIFGPDKLPGMAKLLVRHCANLNKRKAEMESVIKGEVLDVDGSQAKKSSSAASSASAKASLLLLLLKKVLLSVRLATIKNEQNVEPARSRKLLL